MRAVTSSMSVLDCLCSTPSVLTDLACRWSSLLLSPPPTGSLISADEIGQSSSDQERGDGGGVGSGIAAGFFFISGQWPGLGHPCASVLSV